MRFIYVRMLNTRQWTSLRVLSTPYVYVARKNAALEINPKGVRQFVLRAQKYSIWNY